MKKIILIILVLYFIVPKQFRNIVLLIGSLTFYAFGEPIYVLLLLFSSMQILLY